MHLIGNKSGNSNCRTAVLVSEVAVSMGPQLGCRNHPADGDDQSGVLSVVGGELPLDGAHAGARAAAAKAQRSIRQ